MRHRWWWSDYQLDGEYPRGLEFWIWNSAICDWWILNESLTKLEKATVNIIDSSAQLHCIPRTFDLAFIAWGVRLAFHILHHNIDLVSSSQLTNQISISHDVPASLARVDSSFKILHVCTFNIVSDDLETECWSWTKCRSKICSHWSHQQTVIVDRLPARFWIDWKMLLERHGI